MTRINCVPPSELVREHLVAEYRELPRIFPLAKKAMERGEKPGDPKLNPQEYKLGKGHCRFFYDKLAYLSGRHDEICREMRSRGYETNLDGFWREYAKELDLGPWWNGWRPTPFAMWLNRYRIAERLAA